jgi:hypothetical protein
VGSQWPVLRFHDRFELGAGDHLCLEVSPDGSSWTRALRLLPGVADELGGAAGGPLGVEAQSNLRFASGWSGTTTPRPPGDGWIHRRALGREHPPLALALPFARGSRRGCRTGWRRRGGDTNRRTKARSAVRSASDSAYRVQGDYYGRTRGFTWPCRAAGLHGGGEPAGVLPVKAHLAEGLCTSAWRPRRTEASTGRSGRRPT